MSTSIQTSTKKTDDLGVAVDPRRVVIAKRVSAARTAGGWSQVQFALHLREAGSSISRSVIANLESGRVNSIDVVDLQVIARVLGVSLLDLVDLTDDHAGEPLQSASTLRHMRRELTALENTLLAIQTSVAAIASTINALEES